MPQPIASASADVRHPGDLVTHGDQVTIFGPVGTPVPSSSRTGVPRAVPEGQEATLAAREDARIVALRPRSAAFLAEATPLAEHESRRRAQAAGSAGR